MEGLFFLLDEFSFNTICVIGSDGGMIIILVTSGDLGGGSRKMTLQWDSFRADPKRSRVVWDWVVGTWRASGGGSHGGEIAMPVPVPICILAAEPTNEVTIDEMEAR